MSNRVIDYIESHWDGQIRENREDEGTLIGLPYPYTVSGTSNVFTEIYYWGTFFTNKGLEISGRWELVKSNVDNMLYLVDKYGFMPNSNRTWHLNNSQPPFLSIMVRDVFEHYGDPTWLSTAYRVLLKEYKFWMNERNTEIGLNRYGKHWPKEDEAKKASDFSRRVGVQPEGKTEPELSDHYMVCCESGIDCSPRWGFEGYDYAVVDLNSLLYTFEQNMAFFAKTLGKTEEAAWIAAAEKRAAKMLKYMEKDGVFYDYNVKEGRIKEFFSCACAYPLFSKMVNKQYAECFVKQLPKLELEYGLSYTEKYDFPGEYQWGDRIGWPCMQYFVIKALDNYGFTDEAKRIANKYLALFEKVFDETGSLWEKYNVEEGNDNVSAEYTMPPMMGWTAAAYLSCKRYIDEGIID